MSRKIEYRNYLNSSEWASSRKNTLARTDGFCQFCGDIATQVHHVRYPKRFGEEHPHSLLPVCDRCHKLSHGVLPMKDLSDVEKLTELTPNGGRLNYLLSGGRVYASAKSWARALNLPDEMSSWFTNGLSSKSLFKKDSAGGDLEMLFEGTTVYRWHIVAEQLRSFDREWHKNQFSSRPMEERKALQRFQESYEKLVNWGWDLQEKAISARLNIQNPQASSLTQDDLLQAVKLAIAPRIHEQDSRLNAHDVVIAEIKEVIPTLRDPKEFIAIKQAIYEKGLDPNWMPLHPKSKENLSGLTGQILCSKNVEKGKSVVGRLDGHSVITELNTYPRSKIYEVLEDITSKKQTDLFSTNK